MSREDSQFKLRMPSDLREIIEEAAREAKRSLNAEIIARLEMSSIKESSSGSLIPAEKARQMSEIARKSIPSTIKIRILEAVERAISMGHTTAGVSLKDLELDSIPESDSSQLYDSFSDMLDAAGYTFEWDAPDSLWIEFDHPTSHEGESELDLEPQIIRKLGPDENRQRKA